MKGLARSYPAFYLLLNGVLYCVLTWLFLTDPMLWFDRLQIRLVEAVGYTELKTMYIGMMGSFGVFFLLAAWLEWMRLAGVLLAVVSYLGLALVRGWGVLVERNYNELILQLLATELADLVAGLLALYCLYLIARQRRNPYR